MKKDKDKGKGKGKEYIEGFKAGVKWTIAQHYVLNAQIEKIYFRRALRNLRSKK